MEQKSCEREAVREDRGVEGASSRKRKRRKLSGWNVYHAEQASGVGCSSSSATSSVGWKGLTIEQRATYAKTAMEANDSVQAGNPKPLTVARQHPNLSLVPLQHQTVQRQFGLLAALPLAEAWHRLPSATRTHRCLRREERLQTQEQLRQVCDHRSTASGTSCTDKFATLH